MIAGFALFVAALASPCGFVAFVPLREPTYDRDGTVHERVALHVRVAGRMLPPQPLDYDFTYPKKDLDPFTNAALPDPAFQFPPQDLRAKEPELVQFVMAHTTSAGITRLSACPPPSPGPSKGPSASLQRG